MPRLIVLRVPKDIDTAADLFQTMIKEPVVTEREEQGCKVIDLEGDFEHFDMEDLEMWKAYIKITLKDNRIEDEDDRDSRALLSQGMPGMGEVLFSPTLAWVYKQVKTITRTKVVTEKLIDGEVTEHNESEWDGTPDVEWVDITKEFGRKVRIQP